MYECRGFWSSRSSSVMRRQTVCSASGFSLKKRKRNKKKTEIKTQGEQEKTRVLLSPRRIKKTQIVVREYRSLSQERPGSAASARNWNERRSAPFLALCKPTRRNLVREGCRRALSMGASGPP